MSSIKWEEGAICCAGGQQWDDYSLDSESIVEYVITAKDFQLNEICIGDYIEASELDTEQKYNDAVETFELFGFIHGEGATSQYSGVKGFGSLTICHDGIFATEVTPKWCARKLTYPQLMAIGKLKRAMIERSAPKIATDLTPDLVQNPSHYQFFEGVEVIEIIASSMTREQFKGYCLGNRIKYRLRAGNKDDVSQEIAKSDKYVELYDEHKHLCRSGGYLK